MYRFDRWLPKALEVLTGASWRRYNLESENTVFATGKAGNTINEYGWYLQAAYNLSLGEKASFKPTAAVRYDKNSYFKGGFTPRLSANLSFGEHHFRGSWQSAFRNPSPNQLLSDGSIGEVGGTKAALEAAGLYSNGAYTEASVNAYRNSITTANPEGDAALLIPFVPQPGAFTTEKINTWEVGYKTLLASKLFVDVYYFASRYNDFIAAQNILQPVNGQAADLRNSSTTRTYQVNFNNRNEIFASGWGIGAEYSLGKGFVFSANYANQIGKITLRDNAGNIRKDAFGREVEKKKMSDPEVAALGRNFFISPENRYNLSLSNAALYKGFGFAVTYRWTDRTWIEQGNTQGDVWLPSWNTVDAQVSYRLTKRAATLKIGGSNLFNKYYSQGYGLARIGGLYYAGVYFDNLLK
jgi:outer membrane receptor protein involved in Fe transport